MNRIHARAGLSGQPPGGRNCAHANPSPRHRSSQPARWLHGTAVISLPPHLKCDSLFAYALRRQ
jgi:hypothetical protein